MEDLSSTKKKVAVKLVPKRLGTAAISHRVQPKTNKQTNIYWEIPIPQRRISIRTSTSIWED